MAVTKITWENKTGIQNDTSVARKNKVTDEDMNEIKQTVNNNADELNTAKDNIEDLQGGQGTANADITSLKNRVSTLETDNTQNKSDINTLKSDNQTNKSNISTMQSQISDIQQEQQTQNTNIEELQENDIEQDLLISKLKNALLNAETEEAKSLYVEDANKFGQLEVLGNQEQETSTQGKNYFTGNKIASGTEKGVTYSFDNSIFKMNGTTTSSGNIILDEPTGVRLPAGTYTWTIKVSSGNYQRPAGTDFAFYLRSENNYITGNINTSTITGAFINNNIYSINFTITEETEIYLRAFINAANIVFNNLELEIQIEEGSEYTEFEQFIPNKPSPYYPSNIKCLGSNKNLLHMEEKESTQIGVNVKQQESILVLNGTTNAVGNLLNGNYVDIGTFKKGKYIFKPYVTGEYSLPSNSQSAFYIREKNNTSNIFATLAVKDLKEEKEVEINLEEEIDLTIQMYGNASDIVFDNFEVKLKIEEGEVATSYSPYGQGSTKIKISNEAETEEISKILNIQQEMLQGDYFAKEADGWKEVHGWDVYEITGNENWRKHATTSNNAFYFEGYAILANAETPINSNQEIATIINNYFKTYAVDTIAQNDIVGTGLAVNTAYYIGTGLDGISTLEEFKAKLQELYNAGTPIKFYYKLKTPTKLACTEAQSTVLEELNNLELFDGVNNIITSEDIALLKLKYALDVETYVDNKIEEKLANINQQILEIVGGN